MRKQNLSLKCCQSLELLKYIGKRLSSFQAGSIGSVGERAVKLPAVKFGGLTKKSADSAIQPKYVQARSAQVRLQPGPNHYQNLTDSNFAAL